MTLFGASIVPYISETSHADARTSLSSLPPFMIGFGNLLVWFLGYFLTWKMTAYVLMIPSLLLFLSMIFLPETPYWLIDSNKPEEAKKSLRFFRGSDYDLTEELKEIQQKHDEKTSQRLQQSWKYTINKLFSPVFVKPLLCAGVLGIIDTGLSGSMPLLIFMVGILDEAGTSFDSTIGPIIVGSGRLILGGLILSFTYFMFGSLLLRK